MRSPICWRTLLAGLWVLTLVPVFCSADPAQKAAIPYVDCQGLICLSGMINNQPLGSVLLDTGNVQSVILNQKASELKIAQGPYVSPQGQLYRNIIATEIVNFDIAGRLFPTQFMVISPEQLGPKNTPFVATLAFPAFKGKTLEIDYRHKTVAVLPGGLLRNDTRAQTLSLVPFGESGPAILVVDGLSVDGHSFRAQIDTAFAGTILFYDESVAALELTAAKAAAQGANESFPYVDGGITLKRGAVGPVLFSGKALLGPGTASYFSTPAVPSPGHHFEATLGNAAFKGHLLVLDLDAMKARVE